MNKIRVRLLGGFEVWVGDHQVSGFESQKVRALLAYLVCHRHRTFSRDHLTGLLWPEREPEGARHALRQAIYNLRSSLPEAGPAGLILSRNLEIGLGPDAECWLDVEAFEEALERGTERELVDPHHLSAAAQLYRGEFLAGFFVKDSPSFEDWLGTQQVRFREAAVEVLQRLIESYRRRGEYRFGVHYARRLVAIDPLSEEAHRTLMRLFALSGQRSRALAQYEELTNLLLHELAVTPLEATRRLHDSILAEDLEEKVATARDPEPIGPLIPLVGRGPAFGLLREGWLRALAGKVHLTLVTGEAGAGKTRLIKSFLDATTSKRLSSVLKGQCYEQSPLIAYQPFVEVLRSVLAEETEVTEKVLSRVPDELLEDLVRLVPELRDLRSRPAGSAPAAGEDGRRRLFTACGRFLEELCRGGPEGSAEPLILYLEDLHLGDRDSYELLAFLTARLEGPIWILASCHSDGLDRDHPLSQIFRRCEKAGMATHLEVDRLEPAGLEEIASSLVGEAQAAELADFLEEHSAGLPLAAAEVVNFLWDEGVLVARGAGSWSLARPLAGLKLAMEDARDLIRARIRRLPNSTRRLATLAAVMGQSFDAQILQEAADEHIQVVEVGMEILLRRWLIRQFSHSWTSSREEESLALWAQGARRGSFEFSHREIRNAIHQEINPLRRQAMHSQVAAALKRLQGDRDCQALAFHFVAAGEWDKALPYLEQSVERALAVYAEDTAQRYCDQAVEALSRLVASARNGGQAEHWRGERDQFLERMREMRGRPVEA
ncbi:MAG TPA: BTAD domain-containing putative transcriptional regulator [Thermoanaerobaculia bacterium]|nr:BTAD domain-containing putative transcriptional regulator [Thermoanaerobaculia bacterium]